MFAVELNESYEEQQNIIFSIHCFRMSCTKFSFIMSKYIFLLELVIFGIIYFILLCTFKTLFVIKNIIK